MFAAVVIGVDKVGGNLTKLNGAASGAKEIAEWLTRSGYKVELFNDDDAPVRRKDILASITSLIEPCNLSRLVIYFAGHGFLKGPGQELWMLSDAPQDTAAAVDLTSTAHYARYSSVPEIVIVSDACRVVSSSYVFTGISGASIFPNAAPSKTVTKVDSFFATRPGDPAYERGKDEAVDAHGLFTKALIEAHLDAPSEALLKVDGKKFVRNHWLQSNLPERVDVSAQEISLSLTQTPEIRLENAAGCLAEFEGVTGVENINDVTKYATGYNKVFADFAIPTSKLENMWDGKSEETAPSISKPAIIQEKTTGIDEFSKRHSNILNFESEVSGIPENENLVLRVSGGEARNEVSEIVTTRGITAPKLISDHNDYDSYEAEISGRGGEVAIRFADGSGMLVPLLKHYVCEIVRDQGHVISFAYSSPSPSYRCEDLAELRADVLSAATMGLLNMVPDAVNALADRIRQRNVNDPMLGLVAALAYTISGNEKGAKSVRKYMCRDLDLDMYDAWLLGGTKGTLPVVPSVPILSQSWSFIDIFNAPVPSVLMNARKIPGFWTVFESASMDDVIGYIKGDWRDG